MGINWIRFVRLQMATRNGTARRRGGGVNAEGGRHGQQRGPGAASAGVQSTPPCLGTWCKTAHPCRVKIERNKIKIKIKNRVINLNEMHKIIMVTIIKRWSNNQAQKRACVVSGWAPAGCGLHNSVRISWSSARHLLSWHPTLEHAFAGHGFFFFFFFGASTYGLLAVGGPTMRGLVPLLEISSN